LRGSHSHPHFTARGGAGPQHILAAGCAHQAH
jgi:hypothetical protein